MVFIRIDPRLPIVWRTPQALQIGVESLQVVIEPFADRERRMLAAARAGIPSEALPAVGGCSESVARAFVSRIRPTLEGESAPAIAAQVRVRSTAEEAIVRTIRSLGMIGAGTVRPRIGVVIADHAVPLRAYRDWLRDGMLHFAVVFGAESVSVGPVVLPGKTGCLRCADLARRDADPAWPAVATQLIDLPAAASLEPVVRTEALCAAARLAAAASRGTTGIESLPGRRFRRGGGREEFRITPHPECGCDLDLQVPLPATA